MLDAMSPDIRSLASVTSQPPKLTFEGLRQISDLLWERTGVRLGPKRFGTLRAEILRRMEEMGQYRLEDYLEHVRQPDHTLELKQMIDSLGSGEGS